MTLDAAPRVRYKTTMVPEVVKAFITHWSGASASERANSQLFLAELCDIIDVSRPEACIEVHHLIPLSELTEERPTKLADLCLLCANCHRMIHRSDPMLTLAQLRLQLRRASWSH